MFILKNKQHPGFVLHKESRVLKPNVRENNSSSAIISGSLEPLGNSYLQSPRMKDKGQKAVADELALLSGGTHKHVYPGIYWNEV